MLERTPPGVLLAHIRAVGCGGWTWATFVKLDGYKDPWPDPPFLGTARVEIEVSC